MIIHRDKLNTVTVPNLMVNVLTWNWRSPSKSGISLKIAIATVNTKTNKVNAQTEGGIIGIDDIDFADKIQLRCKYNPKLTIIPLTVKIQNAAPKWKPF